jgi:two-component system phosphate regulon response regulator PhoB
MPKILVVDDEPDAIELIKFNLKAAGYEVITAVDGEEALKKARSMLPDLVILDLMLPEVDGLEVCKILRRDQRVSATPILMLTAKAAEIDRVLGLELGADDYVTKPFSPRELVLRVKRLLRTEPTNNTKEDEIILKELRLDVPRHEATVNGRSVDLTATEFKLLTVLARRRGRVQSREQLLHDVWEYDNLIDTRTVDTHMRRLREKLGIAAKYLDTVRGVGYRFVEE